jgi:uroporphyrinogen-III synthase
VIYLLSNQIFDGIESLPVIEIEYKNIEIDFNVDYLLCTSKNGVIGIDKISDKWKNIPAICIGKPTANMVKKLGGKVEYIAKSSYGDELAKEIIQNFNPSRILFPRAKKVLSNIVEVLKENNFEVIEKIVYETKCKKLNFIPQKGIFIFTSPSTVKCFLSQAKWQPNYKAIAIGTRTAKAFPYDIEVSDIQTIDNCIKIAKNMI